MWNWLNGSAPTDSGKSGSLSVFTCDNDQDNVPMISVVGLPPEETLFCVSQSRIPGYKDLGQDVISTATKGIWSCSVLCDGHDRDGLVVAKAICNMLPKLVLDKLVKMDIQEEIPDTILNKAFVDCSKKVCWTNEGICKGMFVKVTGGEWDGKVGYVGEVTKDGQYSLVIVDENGYNKPTVKKSQLYGAKFAGGCTCVCLVRNRVTNLSKLAFVGDSRAMLIFPQQHFDKGFKPCMGATDDEGFPVCVATTGHDLSNKSEMDRLNNHQGNDFEVDGDFLVNPVTGFAIQPTRGFGDFDMYGTGYTCEPELTDHFYLKPGMLLLVASDGVFDYRVWEDQDIFKFFLRHSEYETDLEELADNFYDETLERSEAGGYVDDISFIMFSPTDHEFLDPLLIGGTEQQSESEVVIVPVDDAQSEVSSDGKGKKAKRKSKRLSQAVAAETPKQDSSPDGKKSKAPKKPAADKASPDAAAKPEKKQVSTPPPISQANERPPKRKSQVKESLKKDKDGKHASISNKHVSMSSNTSTGKLTIKSNTKESDKKLMKKKAKSMSNLYFKKNKDATPDADATTVMRQREYTPQVESRPKSLDRTAFKSMADVTAEQSEDDEKLSRRLTIRRDMPGSFADLTKLLDKEKEQASSSKKSSKSRKEKIEDFKTSVASSGKKKDKKPAKSKKDKKSRRKSRSNDAASQVSSNSDGSEKDSLHDVLSPEDQAAFVQAVLSRIATKFGHNLEDLEELVTDLAPPQ